MLRNGRRIVVLVVLAAAASLGAPSAAHADGATGGMTCTTGDPRPECDVNAGTGGPAGGNNTGNGGGGSGSGNGGTGGGSDGCTYRRTNPSPATIDALGGQPTGEGGWYFKTCVGPDGTAIAFPGPIWIAGAPPVITPEELAYQARSRLRLPEVVIRMNPPGDQLVNLPIWLALDPASWRSRSATASVPGVSVTATARPVKATWAMGDGSTVPCNGPGTVWTPGTDPAKASPDCGHVYRRSSAGAPGGAYTVTVTVTWDVTWAGAGQSGTVPGLTTTGQVQTRVQESQTVVR